MCPSESDAGAPLPSMTSLLRSNEAVPHDDRCWLGGLAAGFLLGRFMADREPLNAAERNRAYALGWVAGLVLLASFSVMLLHYFRAA